MTPARLDTALQRWALTPDGAARESPRAVVLPVRREGGERALLKVGAPNARRHEHLALRAWGGHAAVRLLAADPAQATLLLERLDGPDLHAGPIEDACATAGALTRRLAIPAPPWTPPATDRAAALAAALPVGGRTLLPRRFIDQARSLLRSLAADADPAVLVHTDLGFAHVLRSPRGPLAVSPTVVAGEPALAAWPVLRGRWGEVVGPGLDPRWQIGMRLLWWCEAAGVDEDRARAWAIVRTVGGALRAAREDAHADLGPAVTLLKALQPGR